MRYQLVLKKEYTVEELTGIMESYIEDHSGQLGDFDVKNVKFSSKLIWNIPGYVRMVFYVNASYCKKKQSQ